MEHVATESDCQVLVNSTQMKCVRWLPYWSLGLRSHGHGRRSCVWILSVVLSSVVSANQRCPKVGNMLRSSCFCSKPEADLSCRRRFSTAELPCPPCDGAVGKISVGVGGHFFLSTVKAKRASGL
jgi:hypothetical protein